MSLALPNRFNPLRTWFLIAGLTLLLGGGIVPGLQADSEPGPADAPLQVLILHSQGLDDPWTRELDQGIQTALHHSTTDCQIRVELMDSGHHQTADHLARLLAFYRAKYAGTRFSGVIGTGDAAHALLAGQGSGLFGPVPMVVTATSSLSGQNHQEDPKTPVLVPGRADHAATLKQALQQNPTARSLYVLTDDSATGQSLREEVQASIDGLDPPLDILFVPAMPLAELETFVVGRHPDAILYLLPYSQDATGQTYTQGTVARRLSQLSPAPIYVSWDFQVGSGVVGGRVLCGEHLGIRAAQALLDRWRPGSEVKGTPSSPALLRDLYDASALARFHIDLDLLPGGRELINQPTGFLRTHGPLLLLLGLLLLVACGLVLLLLMLLTKQRILTQKQQAILALKQEVIDTQHDLVTMLSEAIETRNKESGNHVLRVAKIARLLGEKLGLPPEELDILEAAAPLHDVGKIAIPEAILHKDGPLSEDEFTLIKEHTTIGKELLATTNRRLLASACSIAQQHHERWDGSGYPNGLRGEQIDIFSRITMLADIYDALSSDRCYKKGWSEEKVLRYIRQETARYFDPYLVSIFLENLDAIREIRVANPPSTASVEAVTQS